MRENTTYMFAHLVWAMWDFVTRCIDGCEGFKWQGGYSAFVVFRQDVDNTCGLILDRKERRCGNRLPPQPEAN